MHPNRAAGIIALTLPFAGVLAYRVWQEKKIIPVVIVAAAAVIMGAALLLSSSRGHCWLYLEPP